MIVRIAILGLGKIARDQHVPVLRDHPGFQVAAVVSRNASLDGVQTFATLEALLASGVQVDAISMCQPPQVRFEAALQAMEAGKHVFLEKPPSCTLSEVTILDAASRRRRVSLFASWHSRHAPGVAKAREWLSKRTISSVQIDWKEDVRVWHPGQTWIWEPGGFGVFDPGINALSVASEILPQALFVKSGVLYFPSNLQAPVRADLDLRDTVGTPIKARFDFLQTGPQTWDIRVETPDGCLLLSKGGSELSIDGAPQPTGPEAEYRGLYDRFAALIEGLQTEVDVTPLRLVADAFLRSERQLVEPLVP